MTFLNFTFQEASPLISYSGLWTEGSPANDTFWASYNGSFRVTQVAQSTASFTFFGTAVSLFGATRPNHGNYTVNLDLEPQFMASGFTSTNNFNKSLWNAEGLPYAQHTVTLTNVPVPSNPFLDLDYLSIERQIGQPGDTIYQLSLDDTSPSVTFVGPWESTNGVSSAYQGTLHSTQDANAQVTFSFQGASLEVYGQYANAPYTVALDNQPPVSLKGLDVDLTPDFQHPQTLLYLVDGLSDGVNHTVTLTNSVANVNRPFYFDYAVVSSTFNLNGTSAPLNGTSAPLNGTSSSPSPSTSQSSNGSGSVSGNSNSSRQTPVAAIAGGVVGALAVIMILGLTLFIRRRRRAQDELRKELVDNEAKPYILHTNVSSSQEPLDRRQFRPEDRPLPPISRRADDFPPRSKDRAVYYPTPTTDQSSSSSGALSPQERPESSPNFHANMATISSTSASRTHHPHSRSRSGSRSGSRPESGSTSRRDKHTRDVSSSSRGRTGTSRETAVQEEDAGIVIDPEETTLKPLPPAYNPTWGRN